MSVIVVGGGIVGLCTAWSLHHRGVDVQVIDANRIGQGASAVNAGWITPSLSTPLAAPGIIRTGLQQAFKPRGALVIRPSLDLSWSKWLWRFRAAATHETYVRGVKALMRLNDHTLDLFDRLADSGVNFEMHQAGILAVAQDKAHMSWFSQLFAELVPLGFKGRILELSGQDIRDLDPAISTVVNAGALTTIDRHVSPTSLTAGLVDALRSAGVKIHEHSPVNSLRNVYGQWRITTSTETFRADDVVLALGASVNSVLSEVGVRLPVFGAKGYSIDVEGTGTAPKHALYLMEPKLGASPFGANRLRIAGVFELPSRDSTPSVARTKQIVEDSQTYLADWRPATPGWESLGAAGLRPATPDSLPFLGPVPEHDGLYVATGHGMLGLTLAPASGEVLADIIAERKIPESALPFQLAGRI
ncbi:NAD(P)/FAD-dependent oxidoreductase [Mycolicibacterium nivoides]|uniref:NAD(P)/FAD-dependent oxidoreductase n=1 Tax=Mycolicibacterium nivoides TaxID=2487344 RepID=UPI003C2C3F95